MDGAWRRVGGGRGVRRRRRRGGFLAWLRGCVKPNIILEPLGLGASPRRHGWARSIVDSGARARARARVRAARRALASLGDSGARVRASQVGRRARCAGQSGTMRARCPFRGDFVDGATSSRRRSFKFGQGTLTSALSATPCSSKSTSKARSERAGARSSTRPSWKPNGCVACACTPSLRRFTGESRTRRGALRACLTV